MVLRYSIKLMQRQPKLASFVVGEAAVCIALVGTYVDPTRTLIDVSRDPSDLLAPSTFKTADRRQKT